MHSTSGQIALVTGANKGIGFEIARCLGKAGLTVFLGARNVDRGQQAAAALQAQKLDVRYMELDLARPETIEASAASIAAHADRLDVLVNNAGIGGGAADGLPSVTDIGIAQRIMQTNFFGTLAVTQAMLPLLRRAPAARIVNVSSGLGSLELGGDPDWEYANFKRLGYGASKAALNTLTVQLAYELRDTGIMVNSAAPGYTATDMNGQRGDQTVEQGAAEAVRLALLGPGGPTGGFFSTSGSLPW